MALGFRRRASVDPWAALRSRHLLLVPSVVPVEDLDGLVRCWYPASDLAGTGRADLAGAGTLRGPHELSTDAAVGADVPSPWTLAYDLEVEPGGRGGPPSRRPDGLHRAFPDGLPTGAELAGLELLLALARRLGGGIRVAGAREVLTPEVASSVELRVLSPTWVRVADVQAACVQQGDVVEVAVAGDASPAAVGSAVDGTPFDVHLDAGSAGAVLVHAEVAVAPEPAVAGEPFGAGPMAVYDLRWLAPDEQWRLAEHLEGEAAAARERARAPLSRVARTLAEHGGGVVVDADGFLVDRYQL